MYFLNRKKYKGIMLLEQLLAITVIAILVIVGIQRYMSYCEQQRLAEIQADVTRLFFNLKNYFYLTGCNAAGTFNGDTHPDLTNDLNLVELTHGRSPYINQYATHIKKHFPSSNKTHYQLEVIATLSEKALPKMAYLLAKTNAYRENPTKNLLVWKLRPSQDYQTINNTWIMAGRLRRFKKNFTREGSANCAE